MHIRMRHIVLVYLGSKIPNYVEKNCEYICKTFPEHSVILITDHKHLKLKKISGPNFKNIEIDSSESGINFFKSHSGHPKDFRSGFWYLTIARFLAIEAVMVSEEIENAIHFESDILIAPSFPFGSFTGKKLEFPRVSKDKAIASVFYVGSLANLKHFNEFVKTMVSANPMETDMTLLAKYLDDHPDRSKSLKSIDLGDKSISFDGASFGMFLTGTDPRNSFGFSTLFKDIPDHDEEPSKYSFSFRNEILIEQKSLESKIVNLHIHSKSSRYFPKSWPPRQLIKNIEQSQRRKPVVVFYPRVFAELCFKFAVRRFRRLYLGRFS